MTESVQFTSSTPAPAEPTAAPAATQSTAPAVPEKFRTADGGVNTEALLKSYSEMERMVSQRPIQQPNQQAIQQPANPTQPQQPAQGFPMQAVAQEYAANGGQLSQQSYQILAQRGYDRATVDSIIAGQKAVAEQRATDVYAKAGGKDAYESMRNWASANFSNEEKMAYTQILNHGNPAQIEMALGALKARYVAANGASGSPLEGHTGAAGATGFASTAEMRAPMSDPRYRTDAAYRQSVERRVMAMK